MVKNNTKVFCKFVIEGLEKDWPRVFYIVVRSKTMVTGKRQLLDIGYKYNYQKVL